MVERRVAALARRRWLLAAGGALVVLAVVLVAALRADGYTVTDVDLHDAGIWVTQTNEGALGRLNTEIELIDTRIAVAGTAFDVLQSGPIVLVHDTSTATVSAIDVGYAAPTVTIDVPDADVALGGTTVALLDRREGELWVAPDGAIGLFGPDSEAEPAAVEVASDALVAVGPDGVVHLADGATFRTYDEHGLALDELELPGAAEPDQLTVVGDRAVALVGDGTQLLVEGGDAPIPVGPTGDDPVLQQPGPASDRVLVAGDDALVAVALDGGDAEVLWDRGTGAASQPVRLGTCVYGAWQRAPSFAQLCDGRDPLAQDYDDIPAPAHLVFRVNRGRIVLNEVATGSNMLFGDEEPRRIDDWSQAMTVEQEDENVLSDEGEDDPELEERTELDRSGPNRPPNADDDDLATRAARPLIIRPLVNDTDPDGDVLVVAEVDGPADGAERLDVVDDGNAVQLVPEVGRTEPIRFTYVVDDGRGGTDTATVTVEIRGDGENDPPETVDDRTTVEAGRTVLHDVLANDSDPDGDAISLINVTAPVGSVQFRSQGQVVYSASSGTVDTVELLYTVADEVGASATGTLTVNVRPPGNLAPKARNDHAVTTVGEAAVLDVLRNDSDPNGDPLTVASVTERVDAEVRWTPEGEVRVSADEPGSYDVVYEVTDGIERAQAVVRVDVTAPSGSGPPIAVRDDVVVRPGVSVLVPVLDNDLDPDGDVLVLQQVEVPDDGVAGRAPLAVEIVSRALLRITASSDLVDPMELTYLVSDGGAQAVGVVVVRPVLGTSVDQPPVTTDDELTVRAGNITSVPVVDNDLDPEGTPLTLVDISTVDAVDGVAFIADGEIRYKAPDVERGAVTIRYTIADAARNRADGTLTIHVTSPDPTDNGAPQPPPLVARTFSGGRVRVPVPLLTMDPNGDTVELVTVVEPPGKGEVISLEGGEIVYQADDEAVGADRLTYLVRDRYGAEGTGVVRIGIAPPPTSNSDPVAVADTAVVRPGELVRVPVLANDSDPDDDPVAFLDGDAAVGRPRVGSAEIDGATVVYRAPAAVAGTEEELAFDYGITDGRGGVARGRITITVTPDAAARPPAAVDDLLAAAATGSGVDAAVLDNDSDPDGDVADLAVTLDDVDGTDATVGPDGHVRFTMGDDPVVLIYRVTDVDGLSAQAFVQVPNVTQLPPVANTDRAATTRNTAVRVPVLANDTDPEGDDLTLVEVVAQRNGTATVDGADVVFTPAPDFEGDAGLTYEVSDGEASAVGTVSVRVEGQANRPPTFTELPIEVPAGEEVRLDLTAGVSDPDRDDTHTFDGPEGAPDGVSASIRGTVLVVAADTSATGVAGRLTFTVSDGEPDGVTEGAVTVRVISSSAPLPQAGDDVARTIQGEPVRIDVLANDTDPIGEGIRVVGVDATPAGTAVAADGGANVIFTPSEEFFGQTTFGYQLEDATADPARVTSGSVTVTVIGRPSAPPAPTGTVDSRLVTLAWGVPAANGGPIERYVLESDTGGAWSCPSNTCAADGLVNGTTYRFRAAAVNEAGQGEWSGWSPALTPDALPEVPAAPTVAFGDGEIDVTWTAPANEGTPIDEYLLLISPPPASGPSTLTIPGATTNHTWTGLTNGTAYTFRVRAHNGAGTTAPSPASRAETPAGVPDAPTAPTGVMGDQEVTAQWSAPANNGDAVAAYQLEVRRNGAVVDTISINDPSQQRRTVGAVNGDSYTFRVRARNKAGWSPWSAESTPVVPAGAPFAVGGVSATAGDRSATLDFAAPNANGSPITGYEVSVNGGARNSLAQDRIVRNLDNGTTYSFQVAACNAVGCGPLSGGSNSVTPFGAPSAPNVSASVSGRTITWNWNNPAGNGRPIDHFEVRLDGNLVAENANRSFSRTFGYAESHTLRVVAVNDGGATSAPGSATARTVDPPAPSITLSTGASAVGQPGCTDPSCRYFHVRLTNFAANRTYTATCHGEGRPSFGSGTVTTNGSGGANVDLSCYYGYFGTRAWVTIGSVESNRLVWPG